jgi:sirohydrochlorin ferrochelatase
VIGILLMDHGSRNVASNQRLHELAAFYQASNLFAANSNDSNTNDDVIIVQAAHMEIATPSITQGLEQLLQRNVDAIICHPFFLSPAGRHVSEDIPRLIEQAVQELNIDVNQISVVTTQALGAQTQVMLNAIHSSITQTTTAIFNKP